MAKFETVYDPEKDKIISRKEATKSNKALNPYFRCPVCKTKESTLRKLSNLLIITINRLRRIRNLK